LAINNVDQLIHEITVFVEVDPMDIDHRELIPREDGTGKNVERSEDNML
jgi:hypothetical protein